MQWFKHHSNFRNTPSMKYMAARLGDYGVAGVYRLYEVFTERFAVNNDFSGSIMLSPPFTEVWLAEEILKPRDDDQYVSDEQLTEFLQACHLAGIIQLSHVSATSNNPQPNGTFKDDGKEKLWTVITIPEFAALADEYACRKRKGRALETTR